MKTLVTCGQVIVVMLSFAAGVCSAAKSDSQGGFDLGIKVSDETTAKDAGLPAYPGSKPYKDSDQTSSGANIGFSIPGFGFKLVAMNLESGDRPERVAAFYRKALSKYGRVLDCSDAAKNKTSSHDKSDDALVCDADERGANSIVYKVGTESNERIVAIRSHGSGTRFSLVHVDKRERAAR
jgi:hypothetical protein